MTTPPQPPVTYSADADGVGWIVFDDPAARANVFSPSALAALGAAIDAAYRSPPAALIVISGKEKIFIAGADLKWLAALPDAATATELSRAGQKLFQRLAEFPAPVVAAIHGACAGGGFELALACHWRIASDAPATQIGLPETGIGTIPGWGGCTRLPRLIGAKPALDHILRAQLVGASEAFATGLVNEVVRAVELKARAKATALKLALETVPPAPPRPVPAPEWFAQLRDTTRAKTRGRQPALLAAIDAVEQTVRLPLAEALDAEAKHFGAVTAGETCKNMIHVFFLRDAAKKRTLDGWFDVAPASSAAVNQPAGRTPTLQKIGVVGAGVMGSGIAHWLATRGFDVVLRDTQPGFVARGLEVMRGLFADAVKRGKLTAGEAEAAARRIVATTAWEGFDTCDLVVEAIVENVAAKQALFAELAAIVRPDALLASNTSALPIEEIAGHVSRPQRTLGIHFFNPVSRMPLIELILGRDTSAETAGRALALVKALGKSPILCRSSPGFLVTRVLFFYLNEAVRLWESGVPTAALDAALRDFGWPMGPLRLIDEVGVDVTDFIFSEMAHYFPGRFIRSSATERMLTAGFKGRKNGAGMGFYRYADGGGETPNDVETRRLLSAPRADSTPAPAAGDITARLMRVMVNEAERCLAEGVVRSPDEVDFALISGAGFPTFRGGLLRWARAQGWGRLSEPA